MTTEQPTPKHTVQIPGQFLATFSDTIGDIVFTFMPSASYAGYFGESFFVVDSNVTPMPDHAQLENQLWEKVRLALAPDHYGQHAYFVCGWEE
jgi:hypothetical protein